MNDHSNKAQASRTGIVTALGVADNAQQLALIDSTKNASALLSIQDSIPRGRTCTTMYSCNLEDSAAMKGVAEEVGTWDMVLVASSYARTRYQLRTDKVRVNPLLVFVSRY